MIKHGCLRVLNIRATDLYTKYWIWYHRLVIDGPREHKGQLYNLIDILAMSLIISVWYMISVSLDLEQTHIF